jgi:hypothetical protein
LPRKHHILWSEGWPSIVDSIIERPHDALISVWGWNVLALQRLLKTAC